MKLSFLNSSNLEPHKIAFYEYGKPSSKAVILLHAFSHNGFFCNDLAQFLSERGIYVICPDMPGRGKSSYLTHSKNYNYHLYVDDLFFILNSLKIENATLMGNSMGGITSILFKEKFPKLVKKIILNDIGIFIPSDESIRIGSFIGKNMVCKTQEQIINRIYSELAESNLKSGELKKIFEAYSTHKGDEYILNYDPKIADAFWFSTRQKKIPDLDFSDNFQNIIHSGQPTEFYLIRGQRSNLFDKDSFERMKKFKNVKAYMEIPNKGHLPLFFSNSQSETIANWILR